MSRYKTELVSKIKAQRKEEEKQAALKKKHGLDQTENVIVVEKNNVVKFLIKTIGILVRLIVTICLLLLAAVGLMTLVYPELREPFLEVLFAIQTQYFPLR